MFCPILLQHLFYFIAHEPHYKKWHQWVSLVCLKRCNFSCSFHCYYDVMSRNECAYATEWLLTSCTDITINSYLWLVCRFARFVPHIPFDLVQVSLFIHNATDVHLSIRRTGANIGWGMKMENVPWEVDRGSGWLGVCGEGKGRCKDMLFGGL